VGIVIPYRTALKLGMIGQFFSTVIPGTVGGDLVKAVYVARRFPSRKTVAVLSILLDRIAGLLSMLILGALGFLIAKSRLIGIKHPLLPVVIALGWLLTVIAAITIVGLLLYPWIARRLPETSPKWLGRLPGSSLFEQLYVAALSYREHARLVWGVMGLAIFMQILGIGTLWTVAVAVFGPPPWTGVGVPLFSLASVLGNCAMSLPISPLGLGVGQIAFASLFEAVGVTLPRFGATIITGVQIVTVFASLLGVPIFLTYRNEVHHLLEAEKDLDGALEPRKI
jgi:uncharacterized membrane protein YbhN (UPF0104 family)